MSGNGTYVVVVISPGDARETGRHQRLARDARLGIVGENGVENRVGDRVGDLVGMPFGDRLGGEEMAIVHVVGLRR